MKQLKILVITSRPLLDEDNQPLRLISVTQIRRCLYESLKDVRIPVEVKFVRQATTKTVQMDAQDDFDVLYYWGYGKSDGSLCFENKFGQEHQISSSSFLQILNLNRQTKPKLVLISACHSETVADKIFKLDIPVISMGGERDIHEQAAILFNQLFFLSWTHGKTLLEAFEEGVKAVQNDADVGDQAYSINPFWGDDPNPWSKRFLLKANSEQQDGSLFEEGTQSTKGEYLEINVRVPISLPQLTENFVGRQNDIHKILKLLENHKIIAVIGAFGLGKTEVTKAVGWYLQERGCFSKGIFWVSAREDENIYHLKNLESLYNAILLVKNGELPEKTPLNKKAEEVKDILHSGETLLVLDNLEIIENDMKLQAFLKALPNSSRVLIATRHNIPELAHNYHLDFLTSDPSIELFLNTLNRTGYFQQQSEDLEHARKWARKISNYLGGHPMALEIIAGRGLSRTLEEIWEGLVKYPKEILEEIDDMTGKPKGVWTSLDLSYNDLSQYQKKLFGRLSIFTGPVDKEAIQAVLEILNPLSILNGLVRRSLIKHQNKNYFFLPVIKMYAESKLKESGEDTKYLQRQAVDYFKEQDITERIRAMDHLKFLYQGGDKQAGRELLNFLLEMDKVLFRLGQWNLDKNMLERSLETFQELKNKKAEAQLQHQLGRIARHRGELDKSETIHKNALKLFEDSDCPEGIARQLDSLGMVYRRQGALDKAESVHKKALAISRKHKNQSDEAENLMRLGLVYRKMGKLDQAEEVYKQSLEIRERLDNTAGTAAVWANIGMVYKYRGELDKAEDIMNKSLKVFEEEDNHLSQANQLNKLGLIYLSQGNIDQAGHVLEKSLNIFNDLDNHSGAASSMNHLGIVYKEQGKIKKAKDIIEKALNMFSMANNLFGKSSSLVKLARVFVDMGELDQAERLIQESLAIAEELDSRFREAKARLYLGLVYEKKGNISQAIICTTQAQEMFERLGYRLYSKKAEENLCRLKVEPPQESSISTKLSLPDPTIESKLKSGEHKEHSDQKKRLELKQFTVAKVWTKKDGAFCLSTKTKGQTDGTVEFARATKQMQLMMLLCYKHPNGVLLSEIVNGIYNNEKENLRKDPNGAKRLFKKISSLVSDIRNKKLAPSGINPDIISSLGMDITDQDSVTLFVAHINNMDKK